MNRSRWWTPAIAVGVLSVAVLLVQGAVAAAQTIPVTGPLGAVPRLAGLDLSPDLFDRIAPLRTDFVRSTLGDSAFAVFAAPPRPARGRRPVTDFSPHATTPADPRPPDSTATTTTTTPPSSGPPATRTPILPVVGDGRLVATMSVDRRTAHATDPITYTVRVRNIGDRGYVGDATVRSHIPRDTTEDAPTECDGNSLPGNPEGVCHQVNVPVPGSSNPDVHQVQRSWSFTETEPLLPGESVVFSFTVTVNPGTPRGTVIQNHAHLSMVGDPDQTTETVKVVVV